MFSPIRAVLAVSLLICATARAATKPVMVSRAPTAPATRIRQIPKLPDAVVEKDIRARFAASKISSHHFQVHVQGGVATIEGNTDILQHKGTATRLAKTAGAVKVVNHIVVSQAARDKAAKNLASGRRRAQVKRGLKRSE